MLFKELVNNVNFEDVWKVLEREYEHGQGAYQAYKQVYEELQLLEPSSCKTEVTLVVAKLEDGLEPGKFIYDVFGIIEGDVNRYALEMTPWEEWLNLEVLDNSIEFYGETEVLAHTLYEMTFFGYSGKVVAQRVDEEKQFLNERLEGIKDGSEQFISLEEFKIELGIIDYRTPKEKEERRKEFERIHAENEKVYHSLLGKEQPWI